MTMTGRVITDEMRPEFDLEAEERIPWAHEYGAIDAAWLIAAGSMVPCYQGRHGFGVPSTAWRSSEHGRRPKPNDVVGATGTTGGIRI